MAVEGEYSSMVTPGLKLPAAGLTSMDVVTAATVHALNGWRAVPSAVHWKVSASEALEVGCDQLFDYFQSWKLLWLKAQVNKTTPPKFAPPKPKVADGLRIARKVCQTTFATEKYKESMRQCFVDVGLSPFQGTGITDDGGGVPFRFREYTNHRRGTLAFNSLQGGGCRQPGNLLGRGRG